MCGVIGIFGHPEASNLAYLGLHALQHRGQESAGIVSSDGQHLHWVREMGHVREIFTEERLRHLPGSSAIGHVRYSTTGDSVLKNAQPMAVNYAHGSIAVAHNGNLVDAAEVRARLEGKDPFSRAPTTARSSCTCWRALAKGTCPRASRMPCAPCAGPIRSHFSPNRR